MRRVFIDTNILIDFVENRPGADAAEKVLENGANKVISLFASPLTFANMAYILGKRFDKEKLYPMLDALEKQIDVLYVAMHPNNLEKYNKHVSFVYNK